VRCLRGTRHGLSGTFRECGRRARRHGDHPENTEGLFTPASPSDAERATDLRVITRRASERVIRAAFELSRRRGKARRRTASAA